MYQGLIIEIKNTAGKRLINDKQYIKCTRLEQMYFEQFLKYNNQFLRAYGNIERIC